MAENEITRSLGVDVKDAAILIVDDHATNVELLREHLIHEGYRDLTGETDPRRVPELCAARAFDLILLDIRMPHLDGFQVMERLRTIHAGDYVPILVLTAQTDQETRRRSLALGANDFLTKPFVAWELLQRVRNMLEIRLLYRQVARQNRDLEARVTERTAALAEALASARRADDAKRDFLAVISHELRTPLNSIIGFAEVMTAQSLGPIGHPDYREYVALIEESGKALLTMVNNILDYTRGATGSIELMESEIKLPTLLATCISLLSHKAQARGVALVLEACPNLSLLADRRRLREIFLSLLDNAIKFNSPGGHVRVRAEVDEAGVSIRVSDDGPGIAPDLLGRIFSPFTQGEPALGRQHEGIGLGLSIVRRFAELHGGSVEIDNEPDRGTTVVVHFPRARVPRGCAPDSR